MAHGGKWSQDAAFEEFRSEIYYFVKKVWDGEMGCPPPGHVKVSYCSHYDTQFICNFWFVSLFLQSCQQTAGALHMYPWAE